MSWEGFVIENILDTLNPDKYRAYYYRTSSGNEIDLVMEKNDGEIWTIEIKRSMAPKFSKGYQVASNDLKAQKRFIIYPGQDGYSLTENLKVIGLLGFMEILEKE